MTFMRDAIEIVAIVGSSRARERERERAISPRVVTDVFMRWSLLNSSCDA